MRRLPPCSTLFPYTTLFRSGGVLFDLSDPADVWVSTIEQILSNGARYAELSARARVNIQRPEFDPAAGLNRLDRKSTRLNSSHLGISYAVFCLKKKKNSTK